MVSVSGLKSRKIIGLQNMMLQSKKMVEVKGLYGIIKRDWNVSIIPLQKVELEAVLALDNGKLN
ncbi:hypothetical protein OMD49_14710 [Bacillus anthracis]|nr:hypothetical protein [Bacillus anthracis]